MVIASVSVILTTASALAKPRVPSKSYHWGVIARNTIGAAVAELREGPFGSFGVTGDGASPPYGRGSLGLAVSDDALDDSNSQEKISFGNEVDFFGDPVLDLTDVGFHVFQTGENASISPTNMPNITFEIDPNLEIDPTNFSSMVWLPDPAPVVNQWSEYLDATASGKWVLTGAAGTATGCSSATPCSFAMLLMALDDGGDEPIIYTAAVTKGRDHAWVGAVDGLRINSFIYDFEARGVRPRHM